MIGFRESLDGYERELITETLDEMFDFLEYLDEPVDEPGESGESVDPGYAVPHAFVVEN